MLIGFVVSEILAISYVALLAVHNGPYGNFWVAHALYHVTLSREVQNNHSYEVFDPYLPFTVPLLCVYDDDYWVWAWRGVKFWLSPLICFVALTTLSHYHASV